MTGPQSEAPAPLTRERWALTWPLVLAAVITWESVSAIPSVGPAWLSFDKLAHFGVFGLLATTIARLEPARRWPLLGPLWAIILVSVYGMGIEFLQSLTPMRSMDYDDWVADTLGAALAVVLYLRWTWYRRLLERPPARRRRDGHCEERSDDLSAEAGAKAEAVQTSDQEPDLDRHGPFCGPQNGPRDDNAG